MQQNSTRRDGLFVFLLLLVTVVLQNCSSSSAADEEEEISGSQPVVQIEFQYDTEEQSFQGTLSGEADLTNGYTELAYDLDGGDLVSYTWDFGDDGAGSTDAEPSNTLTETGSHLVTLTVEDDEGETCTASLTTVVASADNDPPAVRIDASTLSTLSGSDFSILFSAVTEDLEGDELTYLWDFGDGSSSSERVIAHSYSVAGEYQPLVTVTDSEGNSSTAQICIVIIPSEEDDDIIQGPDDYFNFECDPNPAEYYHGQDAIVDLTLPVGPGVPNDWQIIRGVDGVPLDAEEWGASNSFTITSEEDSPARIEYFPVVIQATNFGRVEVEECDVFIYHFDDGGGGGPPPEREIGDEDESKVIYTLDVTLQTTGTLDVDVRVVDGDGIAQQGEFSVTLAQTDPSEQNATHCTEQLNDVGVAHLSVDVNIPAGGGTLYGNFAGETFVIETVTVE